MPQKARSDGTIAIWRDVLIVVGISIVGLYQGASFLIPLATALLLFVLLTALIDRIAAVKIAGWTAPRPLAHALGIAMIVCGLAGVMAILAQQAELVVAALPRYEARFDTLLTSAAQILGETTATATRDALDPLDISPLALNTVSNAGAFLSTVFLICLYIPFMMVERRPMARKVLLAASSDTVGEDIRKVGVAITDGLQRYVGIKTFVSLLTGLFSYAVMKPLGLDFAETWALLAFGLNFIPSIGSILGVVFPALVALVQFDTLGPFLVIAIGCGLVQLIIGNVLEPAITGKSLNLSPFMVILALTFWTALWGIPGAFLSVPITVCLLIIFAHIPATRGLAVLMSGDGELVSSPHASNSRAKTAATDPAEGRR